MLERLRHPIVQAPMAGGPSTPELAAAVSDAGGLGVVAAGYRTPEAFAEDVARARALTGGPLGANLFAPSGAPAAPGLAERYRDALAAEAQRAGVELGAPRFDDDAFAAKIDVLCAEPVDAVSFTFGRPDRDAVDRLHEAGIAVWLTATEPEEARAAAEAGADAILGKHELAQGLLERLANGRR